MNVKPSAQEEQRSANHARTPTHTLLYPHLHKGTHTNTLWVGGCFTECSWNINMSNAKGNSGFRGSGLMDLGVGFLHASPQLNIMLIIMSGMAPFQSSHAFHSRATCGREWIWNCMQINATQLFWKLLVCKNTLKHIHRNTRLQLVYLLRYNSRRQNPTLRFKRNIRSKQYSIYNADNI